MEKLYVITARGGRGQGGKNRILMLGERLDFQSNGYPRLIDENVAFPMEMVYINGETVPDGATADKRAPGPIEVPDEIMPEKWCYNKEKGFFKNPEYTEPVSLPPTDASDEPAQQETE